MSTLFPPTPTPGSCILVGQRKTSNLDMCSAKEGQRGCTLPKLGIRKEQTFECAGKNARLMMKGKECSRFMGGRENAQSLVEPGVC